MLRCQSCKPKRHRIDYPGGHVWRHSPNCPRYASQIVGREHTETLDEAIKLHPAGKARDYNATVTFSKGWEGWNRQPKIGAMTEAASYVDAHVDDEDDDE